MIQKHSNRNTAVFYTCGVCNLNCRYCGIDKNPILKDIDNVLEDSFKGDYYFNRVKEYFPRQDMLQSVETWGGEPFLHMDRIYSLIDQLINYYPFFSNMYSSTNFSYSTWLDQFFGLMDCFKKYEYRDFNYCLQLSIDGPEYINDAGRGLGVTQKCINNFDKLINELKNNRLGKNINLTITLKQTLDNDTLYKLNTKQAIIEYYQFFESNFIDKVNDLNLPNVHITTSIPNTAVPSPVTVADGKYFAYFVQLCKEIEMENIANHYFNWYTTITPFSSNNCQTCLTYKYGYHTCGSGDTTVGFLPNNMISVCHEGFTQIVEEYKALAAQRNQNMSTITFDKFYNEQSINLCTDDEGYAIHEYKMSLFNQEAATARLATSTSIIMALALAGQVEEYYLNEENALKAAIFIQSHTAFCIKDNYNKTGSYSTAPVGLYKLLLNGALQYIQSEEELHILC